MQWDRGAVDPADMSVEIATGRNARSALTDLLMHWRLATRATHFTAATGYPGTKMPRMTLVNLPPYGQGGGRCLVLESQPAMKVSTEAPARQSDGNEANVRDSQFGPANGMRYLDFFRRLHNAAAPRWYLEIGTRDGASLRISQCASIAIDPNFRIASDMIGKKPVLHALQCTSDEAFEGETLSRLGASIDIAFLDGMHLIEFLVRDIANTERLMAPNGIILIHDTRPINHISARRSRPKVGGAWTGDVWKILPILHEYRPDLSVRHVDCRPTGLTLVEGP